MRTIAAGGAGTEIESPTFLPISAFANGDDRQPRLPPVISASLHANDLISGLFLVSCINEAKRMRRISCTWSPDNVDGSRSPRRLETISSSSAIRPSMKDWRLSCGILAFGHFPTDHRARVPRRSRRRRWRGRRSLRFQLISSSPTAAVPGRSLETLALVLQFSPGNPLPGRPDGDLVPKR